MSKRRQAQKILRQQLGEREMVLQRVPAMMGDGNGTVEISTRPGYVWVRINGIKTAAYNTRVQPIEGLAVWVGYDPPEPKLFQVLSLRNVYLQTNSPIPPSVGPHHKTHEWESIIGSDMVYVHLRQWLPLRVGVSSGLVIEVNAGLEPTATGEWSFVVYQTLDLSGDLPDSGAVWALIYLNSSGTLARRLGNRVGSVAALSIENIPAVQSGERALAAVKLYTGQTTIRDNAKYREILDLRYPQPVAWPDSISLGDLGGYEDGRIIRGTPTEWEVYDASGDGQILVGDGTDINSVAVSGDVELTNAGVAKVVGLQTRDLAATAPSDSQVVAWNDSLSRWEPQDQSGSGVPSMGGGNPVLQVDGPLAMLAQVGGAYVCTQAGTIDAVYIYCAGPGSASSTIVDVNLNGTTIFTTQGNRPTLAYDDADQIAKSGTPDVTDVVENDLLTVDIDQVATGAYTLTVVIAMTPSTVPGHAHSGGPHTGTLALSELTDDDVTAGLPLLSGGAGGNPNYATVGAAGITNRTRRVWLNADDFSLEFGTAEKGALTLGQGSSHTYGALSVWRMFDGYESGLITQVMLPMENTGATPTVYLYWCTDTGWVSGNYRIGYCWKVVSLGEDPLGVLDVGGTVGSLLEPTAARVLERYECSAPVACGSDLLEMRIMGRGTIEDWDADANFCFIGVLIEYTGDS